MKKKKKTRATAPSEIKYTHVVGGPGSGKTMRCVLPAQFVLDYGGDYGQGHFGALTAEMIKRHFAEQADKKTTKRRRKKGKR